ncbi:MAG: MFS transporter [Solirubrobacterales bacterium]
MARQPAARSDVSRALVPVLVSVTLVVSVVSSLGAPLLPSVAEALSISLSSAQWSLTAALLAGAVSAPILGRLGDGPHRREAMLGALVVVTLGGVVAGLAQTLWLLILGRIMQGIGLGLVPIAMTAARDHLPPARAQSAIALLSVSGAVGVGAGYPISGLIDQTFDVHAAFVFGGILTALALVATWLVLPRSRADSGEKLDVVGAAVAAAGISALLIGIGQGEQWGWLSPGVLGSFAVAAVVLTWWARMQLRNPAPLVDLRQLRHRAVLGGDTAALLLGVTLYMFLTIVTEYVQTPASTGFGFGKSTLMAGVCLVPFSLTGLVASRIMTIIAPHFETRTILTFGALTISVAGAFFAVLHDAYWQSCLMMGVLGIGFGFTFAAIPGVITRAVPPTEVGSTMGFYQVVRSTGFSIGSAAVASILAADAISGSVYSGQRGYVTAAWIGTGVSVAAAVVATILSPPDEPLEARPPDRYAHDEAELAASGIIDADFGSGEAG